MCDNITINGLTTVGNDREGVNEIVVYWTLLSFKQYFICRDTKKKPCLFYVSVKKIIYIDFYKFK